MKTPFYGWIVVGGAFLVLFLTYGVQYSFGVFVPAMVDDLDWQWSCSQSCWLNCKLEQAVEGNETRRPELSELFEPTHRRRQRIVLGGGALTRVKAARLESNAYRNEKAVPAVMEGKIQWMQFRALRYFWSPLQPSGST